MECPLCHTLNRATAHFCRECGGHLAQPCPACGAVLEPGSKFCDACGIAIGALPTGASARFAFPGNYTPRHLAEKILTSRSALEGERKQVTVLFADVSGFTALAAQLDPEQVHDFMAHAFQLMLAEVHRYEGTVNQFLGDGIMALFGAPIAHEDHARRAVHAALGIREALQAYRRELERQRGIAFELRQGLNTGLVVVGSIGSDLRMDYTAVGDTTNVAARLQQAAEPGSIVISEATHRSVSGYFQVRELGTLALRGKSEPVKALEVIAAHPLRTRLEVEAERGLTPFVGREPELRTLLDAVDRCSAGHGQLVLIGGEAGIGKSRMLLELRRRLDSDIGWLEGHCLTFGPAIPLQPVIDLLQRSFGIQDRDPADVIAQKIEKHVLALGDDLRPTLPYLRYLLSIDPGDTGVAGMDPKRRRAELFEALRRFIARSSEVRPHVIAIEDVHAADPATEELLAHLADGLPSARILLILTYRSGHAPPLRDRPNHTRMPLMPLPPADTGRLARAMLSTERLPEEVDALLAREAEGNPFFVEEILKALLESGVLRRGDRRVDLARPADDIVIPETIHAVIMARIDRLPDATKRALQWASVIGRYFSRELLDRIPELRGHCHAALERLVALEFIYQRSRIPSPVYAFTHALTCEVAYASLLAHRRKELHRQIGEAIEQLAADRLAEHYEVLAYHFSKAEEQAKAVEYLFKAAEKSARAFANREALRLYQQVLELLPDSDLARRAEALRHMATLHNYLGDADASLACAESALELCEQLGDDRNAVVLHLHIAMLYGQQWDGGLEDRGLKHLEAAAALVEYGPDTVEKALVYQRTGHLYLHRSQPTTTLQWARRAVEMLARLGVPMGTSLGTALTYTGHIDEGVAYSEKNWEPVLKASIPVVMAVMGHELALTLSLARDVPRATLWGERVLPHVAKASPTFEAMLRRPLLFAYTLGGDVNKADEACAAIERVEARTFLGCIYEDAAAVGFHYVRRGAWEAAARYLDGAIARYRERNNRAALNACLLVRGTLHLEQDHLAEAEECLRSCLEAATAGDNVLVQLWALPVLSELYLAMGEPGRAAQQLARAFALLAPDRNWYGMPAPVYLASGLLAAATARAEDAQDWFARAISVSRQYRLPWEEARALYESGCLQMAGGRSGDPALGARKRDEALAIFQRIGARAPIDRGRVGKEARQS